MEVLVLSDLHDSLEALSRLKDVVIKKGYDLAVLLGDFTSPFTLKGLLELLPSVMGVFGNNDGDVDLLKTLAPRLTEQPLEEIIEGWRVIMLHGFKSPQLTEKLVHSLCMSGYYDLVLYGHTHIPKVEVFKTCLAINPGTLSGYLASARTYGVLTLSSSSASAAIVDLDSGRELAHSSLCKQSEKP
ncbi:MAG: metallophosphoesterase [Zestosphaera sp.]